MDKRVVERYSSSHVLSSIDERCCDSLTVTLVVLGVMFSMFQNQLRLGLLIATFGLVVSCLITNCPKGGKRSEAPEEAQNNVYTERNNPFQCIPCGPEREGVCLGRNICCGREIGCFASPRHTKPCRNLRTFKSSCLLGLNISSCGENGQCKAKYLCCSKDQCVVDPSCKFAPNVKYKDFNGIFPFNPQILSQLFQKNVMSKEQAELNQDETGKGKNDFLNSLAPDYES